MRCEHEVEVTRHAIQRYCQRVRRELDPQQDADTVRAQICNDVREAFEANRIAPGKPKRFRLYREKPNRLLPNERFLWTEDDSVGYVIKRELTEVVVTTMNLPPGS